MTTDLAQPVIIATVPVPGGPPAPLLIDGTHRLYKATLVAIGHGRIPVRSPRAGNGHRGKGVTRHSP